MLASALRANLDRARIEVSLLILRSYVCAPDEQYGVCPVGKARDESAFPTPRPRAIGSNLSLPA